MDGLGEVTATIPAELNAPGLGGLQGGHDALADAAALKLRDGRHLRQNHAPDRGCRVEVWKVAEQDGCARVGKRQQEFGITGQTVEFGNDEGGPELQRLIHRLGEDGACVVGSALYLAVGFDDRSATKLDELLDGLFLRFEAKAGLALLGSRHAVVRDKIFQNFFSGRSVVGARGWGGRSV